MNLSKQEAIKRHRLMWNWIADETKRQGRCIDKAEVFKHFGWENIEINNDCWCCEYDDNKNALGYYCDCAYCPLDWSDKEGCANKYDTGLFDKWLIAMELNDYENAHYYARQIANLPERKFEDEE